MWSKFLLIAVVLIKNNESLDITCDYILKENFLASDHSIVEQNYFCRPKGLVTETSNKRILSIKGEHVLNYTNHGIYGVELYHQQNPFLPHGFSAFFKNIRQYKIYGGDVKQLKRSDLSDLKGLTSFQIFDGFILEVPGNIFNDLKDLEEVFFHRCALRSIPENLFYYQTKLRVIYLAYNNIKTISSGLFAFSKNVQRVAVDNNQIETFTPFSAEVFDKFDKLFRFTLHTNPCTRDIPENGKTEFDRLIKCNKSCEHVIINVKIYEEKLKKCQIDRKQAEEKKKFIQDDPGKCVIT